MCTVTIIPLDEATGPGVRMACNRDESRTRPAALPPQVRSFGSHAAIMPIDPAGGGTWIAVNGSGLAATLLNVYATPVNRANRPAAQTSRGILIPQLMECDDVDSALARAGQFEPASYQPFRLVLVDRSRVAQVRSDGLSLQIERLGAPDRPLLFTSSGLGDAAVEGPRRELFEELFAPGPELPARQAAFHRHCWPDRRHLSVCMERAEARTVSHTVVDITSGSSSLAYHDDPPGFSEQPRSLRLTLRETAGREIHPAAR